MGKTDKELKELLDKFEEIIKEIDKNDGKELKEAKEAGIKLINKSKEVIVLATEDGSMFAGTGVHITATIATMIHSLINNGEIPEEKIVEACLRGITDKKEVGNADIERVNLVLETLKKITE